jgi:hypothetical protein
MRSDRGGQDPRGPGDEPSLTEVLDAVEGALAAAAVKGGAQQLLQQLNELCGLLDPPRKAKADLRAQVTEAARAAKRARKQFKQHLDGLAREYGGRKKPARPVPCPVCKGTGTIEYRDTTIHREACRKCRGTGTIEAPIPVPATPSLASYLPKGMSWLQKHILQIALDASPDRTRTVATKLIRQRLRSRSVAVLGATFSKSLIGLELRGLIERLSAPAPGSAERPAKTSAIRLTVPGRLAAHALDRNC